jgi:hypothetical protein
MAGDKSPKIFLNDESIIDWDRPLKPDYIKLPIQPRGYTEIVDFIGMDTVDSGTGQYRVKASAAKYLAKIMRVDPKNPYLFPDEEFKPETQEEILFSGSITVYTDGKISGTEFDGLDLEKVGRIWIAKRPNKIVRTPEGLAYVVLGMARTEEDKNKRIRAVIRGYNHQENAKRERVSDAIHENYQRGRLDYHEGMFGTFSRVPFKKF